MKQQRGAALVVVLSMLTGSMMLGLSGIQSSLIDERLAGNYKAATEAQMGAEKAISTGWGASGSGVSASDFDATRSRSEVETYSWTEFSGLSDISTNACSGNIVCHYYLLQEGSDFFIAGRGAVVSEGNVAAVSQPVFARVEFTPGPNPLFTNGLLSADYIWVTGQSTVHGNVHSNGTVDISLRDGSEASVTDGSDGMVEVPLPGTRPEGEDMSACDDASPPAYCYKSYDSSVFAEYQAREGVINDCSIDIDMLNDGDTVFCAGDLVVDGGSIESQRVTLVATGNITMNGATSSGGAESEVGLFVIAGQDIEFNGSTDNYGVFWAGGYVRQNGNSSLYGAIVSGTYIRSNGGIDFISLDNVTNPDTFVPANPRIVAWQ
ncbi:pilus assembly PilX family protein [Billgrantia saliphila]|uniref:pilus assembly PilX family protein n=1 Tax=Billgrantia saliphila TaxID=1848458 RepID=UPI000CE4C08C|nr:PilX N-terminal domain-containing pilus assembly protein [Halomonas saliphila]